ncbi:MAG TPA: nucleoside-triphosphatase [Dehalococcoidia bacterium]|nr:nucleoside-triphosphatase [Dehalococcoidia bacterium]
MATRIFLLTSNPGVGKTTLVHKLIARWKGPVGGFTTEEIRPDSRRQGFKLITLDGQSAVIAGTDIQTKHRLGRINVDVDAIERVGVPALERALEQGGLIVIDEIGKPELLSSAFIDALHRIVASDHPVLATLMLGYHEEVEALIKHPEARVVQVTLANRNELVHQIAAALRPFEGSSQPEAAETP